MADPLTNKTLIEAEANHNVWTLKTEEPDLIYSLTCPRPAKSIGMRWERAGVHNFIGRFYSYADVRQNLYRLVMRSCTYGFKIQGCSDYISITATDGGYVDTLPVLAKHSKKGRYDIKKQKLLEAPSNLDVSFN
jgi:hypothetical protein